MDKGLYIAMSGAGETMRALSSNSNNLANAGSTGFRSDFNQFRSQKVMGPGYDSRVYAMSERPSSNLAPGRLIQTGRSLDVALKNEGWISIQTQEGGEAYTRQGNMQVSSLGQLLTGSGVPVLGDDGPIAVPPGKVEIGEDGTVSITPLEGGEAFVADRIKLVNPLKSNIEKGKDGLFHTKDGTQPLADASVKLVSGMLESSNVNPIQSMVEMISLSRHFELQVKMMKTMNDNDGRSAALLRMS